ncbi:hypothetical protein QQZ08_001358 [Neonectria magnoliae]|uniref:1-alkyl-2-acetylglycerophosphocholine esterase n=1 Tax=Neonectria magnoliae TaxID=2732573 RepID=A0ABR1IEL6_9HYPO
MSWRSLMSLDGIQNSRHKRRILTSFFLPVHVDQDECEVERIDHLPPKSLETYEVIAKGTGLPNNTFQGFELEFCKAPSKKQPQRPIVIYSPGFSGSRLLSSAQAQSLASRGNVVITVDHPYEATVVEFPNGTVVWYDRSEAKIYLSSSTKSQSLQSCVPASMEDSTRNKIFVYGHSLGGATAPQVAFNDDRVLGSLDLDGKLYGAVSETGHDAPCFLIGAESSPDATAYLKGIMEKFRGPKMLLTINGTKHMSFVDMPLLFSLRDDLPPGLLEPVLGSIDDKRMAHIVDHILRTVTSFLFKGKSESLYKIEDVVTETGLLERDLKGACYD